ncbi:MAG: hypothetical protein MUO19_08070 [Dehalococcoidales bacterium]|nr:hypothetical protein [Dehalococcoidales bacterium]
MKILPLTGSDASADRRLTPYVGKTGTVVGVWCLTKDEMPELSKSFVYPDVWCCDVRLDEDGTVVRGIPEVALEPYRPRRK